MEKAVILARGLGKRMRRADDDVALDERQQAVADTGVKALIPIGRPFLDYVLSGLADAGYRRVCLVVAPDHEILRRYYCDEAKPTRVTIEFAVQVEPRGTADAVAAAEAFAGPDPFVVVNSDNYYPVEALAGLGKLTGMGVALFEQEAMFAKSNISADRIRQFAVGRISGRRASGEDSREARRGNIGVSSPTALAEHELLAIRPGDLQGMRQDRASLRGELEITDAVQYAIDVLREPLDVVKVRAAVLDMTSRKDVATIAPSWPELKSACKDRREYKCRLSLRESRRYFRGAKGDGTTVIDLPVLNERLEPPKSLFQMWATGGWSPGFSRLKPGLQLCECPFGTVSK